MLIGSGGRLGGGTACGDRVRPAELRAGPFDGEHPVDPRAFGVATPLPERDFGDQYGLVWDASVEALAYHHTDFDLDHVEPTRVLGRVVELQAGEDAASLGGGKPLIEG